MADGPERTLDAGGVLLRRAGAEAVPVTIDEQGMAMVGADGRREHHPTRTREVDDATGAGDAVLGVLGLCPAGGARLRRGGRIREHRGGLEVERRGVAPPGREDLLRELASGLTRPGKID
jgi:D-beta-D-heptose 7-phosphate kinase/D-beta-D-heptose 1-phosphate adenosyltransferase